jgi:hypothetical protein
MLRQAVESFEPRTPLRDDSGKFTGEFGDATSTVLGEHEAIRANADVGHYVGRGAELATDLLAVGVLAHPEGQRLLDAARDGYFDASQRALAEGAADRLAESAARASGETPDDVEPATQAQPVQAPAAGASAPQG